MRVGLRTIAYKGTGRTSCPREMLARDADVAEGYKLKDSLVGGLGHRS